MLSDPADMSGSGLGKEQERLVIFRDKEPTEEAEEWTGEVEVQ